MTRMCLRASVAVFLVIAFAAGARPADRAAERRVLEYIRNNLRPGEPIVMTDLYNRVFTAADERAALNKLYNAFFRIPLFVVQYQERFGAPPALAMIAQQFDLESADGARVLLAVMESDPRVPKFIARDAKTGEISRVDAEAIRNDSRFNRPEARRLGGWEGQPAPDFRLARFSGGDVALAGLRGKTVLLYVWFTGCPPCMEETPRLVRLEREFGPSGLVVIGANADRLLGLGYDDAARARYAEKEKISFTLAHWTRESDSAYGSVAIFPTLFLIDREGVIRRHWVGFASAEELAAAASAVTGRQK